MTRCNAITGQGTPCKNGVGCPHHREHCRRIIRQRALAAVIPSALPEQLTLWEGPKLSRLEIAQIIERAKREERASRPGNCGCLG